MTFTLGRGRTLLLTRSPVTPTKHLLGAAREELASAADERGRHAGIVERTYQDPARVLLSSGGR